MKKPSKENQLRLWKSYNGEFKGRISSYALIYLSKRYLGEKIIDVGAGSGDLSRILSEKYSHKKDIIAIDIVPKNKLIKKGDCTKLIFEDNHFDTLFCTDVIEHLNDEDLDKCINEANRVLKKGGYGIFSTINQENLETSIVTCPECGYRFHRWGHCRTFDESSIRILLEKKGFKIIKVKQLNLGLLSRNRFIMGLIYFFYLDRILKFDSLYNDLFIVAKKINKIDTTLKEVLQ